MSVQENSGAVPVGVDPDGVEDHPADISANVATELVEYIRSNTIRNEQQFLLLNFSAATCFLEDPDCYNSVISIGTSSSGKTHVMGKLKDLLTHIPFYETTSGTAKSMVYDDTWDKNNLAFLNELQKHDDDITEFLKSAYGGDDGFTYKMTKGSVRDGFTTEEITRKSLPYFFTFAQWDADFELWNRLLKIPIHESKSKNEAVGAMAFDHSEIRLGEDGVEYGYDYEEGTKQLQYHYKQVEDNAPGYVYIPTGDVGWDVWDVMKPIFNPSRSEVNRIYQMVANLIRGSAILNYHARKTTTITVNGEEKEAVVASPQDVANVLRCRRSLLATTHEIDHKKRAVATAIETKGGKSNEVIGIEPITEFLSEETDAPMVKQSEMKNIMADLEDNYIIDIHENAGPNNKKDIYEYMGWDELGFARVEEHRDVFDHAVDPVGGGDFLEWHREYRDKLDTNAQEMLKKVEVTSASDRTTDDGDSQLSSFGSGTDSTPDLDVVEEYVLRASSDLDGVRISDLRDVPVEAFIGLVDPNSDEIVNDVTGSALDPEHSLWNQPDRGNQWVTTREEARRLLKSAIDGLIGKQCLSFDTVHETDENDNPVDVTLDVNNLD